MCILSSLLFFLSLCSILVVMKNKYDVAIVGAGPAGIFTALKMALESNKRIVILEQGKSLNNRHCFQHKKGCLSCQPCNLISGWGGSGAFSDGKLLFTKKVGGWLGEYLLPNDFKRLIFESEQYWLKFGAPEKVYGLDTKAIKKIKRQSKKADLKLITYPIRHMGSDGGVKILQNIYAFLKDKVEIRFNAKVKDILVLKNKVNGVVLDNGIKIKADSVVIAPGRAGSSWLIELTKKYGLHTECNPVDLGVRVEIPSNIFDSLAKVLYELKVYFKTKTFKDKVRTFCVCPNGEVTMEQLTGDFPVKTVNGHSLADKKTNTTNFALLVSNKFTEPFKDPILYTKSIANLSNILSGGIMVQRLKDLALGQRSTKKRIDMASIKPSLKSAVPGDLSFVLPHRYIVGILETLQALDRLIPGIWGNGTLLYGVEIKLYSSRIKVNKNLETELKNLFVAGDGAGLTRGLVHASVSGLVIARAILEGK